MSESGFYEDIIKFNEIYKLQSHAQPTLLGTERLLNFKSILGEELTEVDDLIGRYRAAEERAGGDGITPEDRLALLTELSDWLGDIVVYCASEARRWGIPLDQVLKVIMSSNFSKLGADGRPIYDERGKVMKGPGYWKPEPKISEVLRAEDAAADE